MNQPVDEKEMTCARCGSSKGRTYVEPAGCNPWCGKNSWFCLTPACLKADSDTSKEIARKKYFDELTDRLKEERATRKELGIQERTESTRSPFTAPKSNYNPKNALDIDLDKLF